MGTVVLYALAVPPGSWIRGPAAGPLYPARPVPYNPPTRTPRYRRRVCRPRPTWRRLKPSDRAISPKCPAGTPAGAPMRTLPPLAVLVVDDNRDAADTLAVYLRYAGHRVRTAYSAADAGRVLATGFRPDAVLVDVAMPGTTGYDVAREVCA